MVNVDVSCTLFDRCTNYSVIILLLLLLLLVFLVATCMATEASSVARSLKSSNVDPG